MWTTAKSGRFSNRSRAFSGWTSQSPDDDDRDLLLNAFGFHPLAVDSVLDNTPQTVRVEDFGRYVFINAQSVDYTLDEDVLQTADLTIFIGPNYVVTAHDVYMPSIEAIRKLVEVDGRR